MEPVNVIVLLIQLATPFATLLLGWWYMKQQKASEAAKDTERKLAAKEQADITKAMTDATEALNATRKEVEELTQTVAKLSATTSLNGRCTSELAQLVMVLAEGLRDQHLDGNITRAVDKYRRFEASEIAHIMSDSSSAL